MIILSGGVEQSFAHPAHATPVNYPYVVGFERFHSSLDDDEYLAQGGLILLNELNCVACHAPPPALASHLTGVEASVLDGVASRLKPLDLELMIRSPRFLKQDTIMPSLFSGPDRDLDEIAALKHFLSTLTSDLPVYPKGEVEKGRRLYHRVGCAACHAPEAGFRPEGIPESAGIDLAGLPSVPMNLADSYSMDALVHFLLDPVAHRPSGRMPNFRLALEEASDLAAYLKAGGEVLFPENLQEAMRGEDPFRADADLARHGRELFRQKNCTACHALPETEGERTLHLAAPLEQLRPQSERGCFSERPVGGGVPFYGLDEVQRRAISAALERLGELPVLDAADEVDWRMKRLNCYACHERGGVGGPETAREVYFGFATPQAMELGRSGHLPPTLDHIGVKLTERWMRHILLGEGDREATDRVRHYQAARMPEFKKEAVEPFLEGFRQVDSWSEPFPFPPLAGDEGAPLLSEPAFLEILEKRECLECHQAPGSKSGGLPGIDLRLAAERLEAGYFLRLLLDPHRLQPGTAMPDAFEASPADAEEIRSLWRYLKESSKGARGEAGNVHP